MYTLVLLRHGQSAWNLENRFTGWTDVDLTDAGRGEAAAGAELLKAEGLEFDIAYTSVLKRAIRTLWITLDTLDLMWIPVHRSWRLNERHYGALQGLNKAETAAKHGEEQVKIWRRSFDTPPPPLEPSDPRHPGRDPRYVDVPKAELPLTESLKDTIARVMPYWEGQVIPRIREGKKVLIAAHGNSLRALVKHLDGLTPEQIMEVNIPTGVPLVYQLDANLRSTGSRYLGDPERVAAAMHAVASQGSNRRPG